MGDLVVTNAASQVTEHRKPAPWRDLTSEEIAAFQRDGVICLRELYSADIVATLAHVLDDIAAAHPPLKGMGTSGATYEWMTRDDVRDFVLFGPTARPVQQALQSQRLSFFFDQEFIKEKNVTEPTPWHHDYTFWPIQGRQIASVWTAMEPVTPETSALEFVAGSHRWKSLFQAIGLGGKDVSTMPRDPMPDIEANRDQYEILSWDLEPGDALLFHARTLHGARGNCSMLRKRRAMTTRWIGEDVRFASNEGLPIITWDHGLKDGDPARGPLFPQVLPFIDEDDVRERMRGPIAPMKERVESLMSALGVK
jgi:ectoine hydroxylase-related dioxygenase (phytanoyl-CoA dioxygenase family)